MVGKKELFCNINNVASYTISYNSTNVLHKSLLDLNIIEGIGLIDKKAKGYACKYLKMMQESINLALYARVIVECISVEVAKSKVITL